MLIRLHCIMLVKAGIMMLLKLFFHVKTLNYLMIILSKHLLIMQVILGSRIFLQNRRFKLFLYLIPLFRRIFFSLLIKHSGFDILILFFLARFLILKIQLINGLVKNLNKMSVIYISKIIL